MPTCVRASADTMPWVTVCPTPNGLPSASTTSPTCSSSELPRSIAVNFSRPSFTRSTARSVRASFSSTSASNSRLSESATFTSLAPSMTWLLVMIRPEASTITPEPSARCTCSRGMPPPPPPKKRRKNGSSMNGLRFSPRPGRVDVDHRGGGLLHHRRIGHAQFERRGRHAAVLRHRGCGRVQREGDRKGGNQARNHGVGSGFSSRDIKA